jgi:predicted N-acetyltransferase YhbS
MARADARVASCDLPPHPNMQPMITYSTTRPVSVEQYVGLLRASGLAPRRPVEDEAAVADMLRHAQLMATAWDGDRLVGAARTLTDFSYVAYLADLAVDAGCQRHGVGRRLIEETRAALGPKAWLVLLAAPAAQEYYPRIGFAQHPSAWTLRAEDPLTP